MDNRHQSEREYIRYHAATSGEHLVAGIHGLAHGKSHETGRLALPPQFLRGPFSPIRLQVEILAGELGVLDSLPSSLLLFSLQLKCYSLLQLFTHFQNGAHIAIPSCSLASLPQSVIRCHHLNPFLNMELLLQHLPSAYWAFLPWQLKCETGCRVCGPGVSETCINAHSKGL